MSLEHLFSYLKLHFNEKELLLRKDLLSCREHKLKVQRYSRPHSVVLILNRLITKQSGFLYPTIVFASHYFSFNSHKSLIPSFNRTSEPSSNVCSHIRVLTFPFVTICDTNKYPVRQPARLHNAHPGSRKISTG